VVKEYKAILPIHEFERKQYTSASPALKAVAKQLHFYLIAFK
jgi:hypothetical protein